VRALLADYAVVLTITIFVLIDNYYGLATPKLIVPTEFKVTNKIIT
jgi:HCO3- transporter family